MNHEDNFTMDDAGTRFEMFLSRNKVYTVPGKYSVNKMIQMSSTPLKWPKITD